MQNPFCMLGGKPPTPPLKITKSIPLGGGSLPCPGKRILPWVNAFLKGNVCCLHQFPTLSRPRAGFFWPVLGHCSKHYEAVSRHCASLHANNHLLSLFWPFGTRFQHFMVHGDRFRESFCLQKEILACSDRRTVIFSARGPPKRAHGWAKNENHKFHQIGSSRGLGNHI